MTLNDTIRAVAADLRRVLQAINEALSAPARSEVDAFSRENTETVFQPDAATARAAQRPSPCGGEY